MVIGVLEPSFRERFGQNLRPNGSIFLPLDTLMRVSRAKGVRLIFARMEPSVAPEAAERAGDRLLRGARRRGSVSNVTSAQQLIERMRQQGRLFTLLLGAVGGISLIVGGVGVMNLMLISVSERRGEIGLRRALGARRRDIRRQFVIESVGLCLAGGAFGVLHPASAWHTASRHSPAGRSSYPAPRWYSAFASQARRESFLGSIPPIRPPASIRSRRCESEAREARKSVRQAPATCLRNYRWRRT